MDTVKLKAVIATVDNVKGYRELIDPGTAAPTTDTELFSFRSDLSIADSEVVL